MIVGTAKPQAQQPSVTRGDRVRASSSRRSSSAPSKSHGVISDMSNDVFLGSLQDIIGGLERPN